jgi:HK97 family phage major capsid protein
MELIPKLKKIEHRQFIAELNRDPNSTDNTIELSASSDTPYLREFGYEVLDHSQKSVDLSRMLANAPVLVDHMGDQVGAVKKAWLEGNKMRAVVQFSKSSRGQEIQQDIMDGIRTNVSIGYMVNKFTKQKQELDGIPVYKATSWTPMEISMVSVPADCTVGVGRSVDGNDEIVIDTEEEVIEPVLEIVEEVKAVEETSKTEESHIVIDEETTVEPVALVEEEKSISLDITNEQAAVDADESSVQPAIHSHIQVLEKTNMKNNEEMVVNPNIALTEKEQKEYSLSRAIYNLSRGNRSGFEFEVSQEIEKKSGETNGLWVPTSMKAQRALSIGSATEAGALTFTAPGEFVDYLRNRAVVAGLGASVMSLPGKIALPRATSDNTANWVAEDGANVTAVSQSFDQITLSPKKMIAQTAYSLEALRVANFDIEMLTRTNMYNAFATAFDKAALQGSGNAPTGLINLTGLQSGSHTPTASVLTYADAVELIKLVQESNADYGSLNFIMTPAIWASGKTTIKSGSTANFIISDDNTLAGYGLAISNNLTAGVLGFGNWNELILAEFGAIEIVVDPYTNAGSGKVVLTAAM